jgi:C-terminal processing protease CtpA/Prc
MYKKLSTLAIFTLFLIVLAACAPLTPVPGAIAPTAESTTPEPQPTQAPAAASLAHISGSFTVTNDIIFTYYVEHAVSLIDMHGFVTRDPEWEIPVESQVMGYLATDSEALTGEYIISLPLLPRGQFNDVDNNATTESGVQIFAVAYNPNLYGDPFSAGDDRSLGWPGYLASVKADSENDYEIIGGKLIVWSPDANQQFPAGFGADGLLFTADDPVAPIGAGYTIVDLDTSPFTFDQSDNAVLDLHEPTEAAVKDFSSMSYTEALDALFEFARINYAFNGIQGKQPNWDALYADLKPRAEQAQKDNNPEAFYFIIKDFTLGFEDGHVGLGGGQQFMSADFTRNTDGGYGFAIRELDDGRVLAFYLVNDAPAARAGMQVGAEITEFNGKPIAKAIAEVNPRWVLPVSSDFQLRYQQQRYLLRAPLGTTATVTFTNPGGAPQTVELTAIAERQSFARTSVYYNVEFDYLLPVDSQIISRAGVDIGYIRINANYDDLNLLIRLFERALQQFEQREITGIIIDMRYNSGGAPLGLAGFLTEQEIPTGQDEYFSEATGKFEPEGLPGKIIANENQYRFDKQVLLVNQTCASACEFESYGFSQVPGMIVVGMYPTGGIYAEVSRGQIYLPDDLFLQMPTGRTVMPDGSLFLEGVGVQPTLRVPVDETTIYSDDDVVLEYGILAILQPLGAGITPSAPPKVESDPARIQQLAQSAQEFSDLARETYTEEQLSQMGQTFTYTVELSRSRNIIWGWGWCASSPETLAKNYANISLKFTLNGQEIALDKFGKFEGEFSGLVCQSYYSVLSDWKGGEHNIQTAVTFTAPINDGQTTYPAGTQIYDYTVYVKP